MKLLVNIFVPAVNVEFDILVPEDIKVRLLTLLVTKKIEELTSKTYISSNGETLCHEDKNILLRQNTSLNKYGIKNGDRLIIV